MKEIIWETTGDPIDPHLSGMAVIAHVCNDMAIWNVGFLTAVADRWPQAKTVFQQWYANRRDNDFGLGAVQFVPVRNNLLIANMVCRRAFRTTEGGPRIIYQFSDQDLKTCLERVAAKAAETRALVHIPLIGSRYAGGHWIQARSIIEDVLCANDIDVRVYPLKEIDYVIADITNQPTGGKKILAHVCGDNGVWDRGITGAVSARWPDTEDLYLRWYQDRHKTDFGLGAVQFVEVRDDLIIANMVARHGNQRVDGMPPIRYDAVGDCLKQVAGRASDSGATVLMPRIGVGFSGGKWEKIEAVIIRELCVKDIDVRVYN